MKKQILVMSLLLVTAFAFGQNVVKVKNAKELLNAIAPNTTIQLAEGNYELPNPIINKKNPELEIRVAGTNGDSSTEYRTNYDLAPTETDYVKFSDGYTITGVDNLTIIGVGKARSHIFIKNQEMPVITFEECKGLSIENVKVGHMPAGKIAVGCGGYESPVFSMSKCDGTNITNTGMYGCGNWAIKGSELTNLTCTNSDVFECNVGLVTIESGDNIKFINTRFKNNTTGAYAKDNWFNFSGIKTVSFDKCEISNNAVVAAKDKYAQNIYYGKHEFVHINPTIDDADKEVPSSIKFTNCKFANNKYQQVTNKKTMVTFVGAKPI